MGSFQKAALRDGAILVVVAFLWTGFAARSAGEGLVADLVGVLLGLALGVCAFLLHEWGHLLGALVSGSTVAPPRHLSSVYLFSFDSKRNSRRQFLTMSLGGFVVTGVAVWCAYGPLAVPLQAARVARGAIMFLASLTVLLEFPLVIWSLVAPSLPPVETFAVRADEGESRA